MIINNNYRLTIDTQDDFEFIKRIFKEYKKVYRKYDYLEINKIRNILNKKKSLIKINNKIKQFVPEV
jgi:spore coat polysaccharide biosynthesis protein SpsF (cytidylyltransferase family)